MPAPRLLVAAVRGLPAPADGPSDVDLVGRFAAGRDEGAFALLVRRHGPTVFGVCRRLLRHDQDAEDAFQAVFLVLARRAAGLRRSEAVGNWLYGVAVNVARKARAARLRRREVAWASGGREPSDGFDHQGAHAPRSPEDQDLAELIDRELLALPDKYRTAVVLCDLNGRTVRDAAAEVGCPAKTLGTRLLRGRALLAGRLSRRGVTLPAVGLAVAVPPRLSGSVLPLAAGRAAVPPAVAALTHGALTVTIPKTLTAAVVLAGGLLAAMGWGGDGRGPVPAAVAAAAAPVPADPPAWKHFKAICGDTKESRALFELLAKDAERAKLLDKAATDPAAAAKEYAAAVPRLREALDKVNRPDPGRPFGTDQDLMKQSNRDWRAALAQAVPPEAVAGVLFLGSFPLPAGAADPADGFAWPSNAGFVDLVNGPHRTAARKLFAAWLDRRREPAAIRAGLDGSMWANIPDALPVARRVAADPAATPPVLQLAALVLGNYGTAAEDLPRLAKFRDDARYCYQHKERDGTLVGSQVRDFAAAMSLVLRGRDFTDYGFSEAGFWSVSTIGCDPVPIRISGWFPTDADRDVALKKAWAWLDAQPKPEPAKADPPPAARKEGKRREYTLDDLRDLARKDPKAPLRLAPGDTAAVTYPIDPDDVDVIRCMTTNGRVTVAHEPADKAIRIVIRAAAKAEALVEWEVVRINGVREAWKMTVVFGDGAEQTLADRELKKLAGTWKVASQRSDGRDENGEDVTSARTVIRADGTTTSTARVNGQTVRTEGRLEFVGGRTGVKLDLIETAATGTRTKALYEWVDADTFRIVTPTREGADRPTRFAAEKGSGWMLTVLKRVME